MSRIWTWCLATLLCFLAAHVRAAPADVFTDAELAEWQQRFGGFVEQTYTRQLLPLVEPRLRQVELKLLPGREGGPIVARTDGRSVSISIQTLRLMDEVAAVTAYLDRRDCSRIALLLYVAKLQEVNLGRAAPPGPLAAFGVDETIFADQQVKNSANRDFNGLVLFVLGHELGHVASGQVGIRSVALEQQADDFGLKVLGAAHIPPTGVLTFFQLVSLLEGYPNDHPLSGSRLRAIASTMDAQAESFVDPGSDPKRFAPVIRAYGQKLATLADQIDAPQMRAAMKIVAAQTTWQELRDYARDCRSSPILRRIGQPPG